MFSNPKHVGKFWKNLIPRYSWEKSWSYTYCSKNWSSSVCLFFFSFSLLSNNNNNNLTNTCVDLWWSSNGRFARKKISFRARTSRKIIEMIISCIFYLIKVIFSRKIASRASRDRRLEMPFWNSLIISRGHLLVTLEIWLDEIFFRLKKSFFPKKIKTKEKERKKWFKCFLFIQPISFVIGQKIHQWEIVVNNRAESFCHELINHICLARILRLISLSRNNNTRTRMEKGIIIQVRIDCTQFIRTDQ